jgi:Mg/Co/Ni transporter MgtE
VTDTPEEVTEEVVEEATEEVTEQAPVEQTVEADKPNLLHTIINNPMWLALLFLTVIVLALVILA